MKTQAAVTGFFFIIMLFASCYLFFGLTVGIVAGAVTVLFVPALYSVSKEFSQDVFLFAGDQSSCD